MPMEPGRPGADGTGRTLVLGDVHGAARALDQVFERARFDPRRDRLIALGDLCDGWPEVDLCIDRMLVVERLTLILGNHDEWASWWMKGLSLLGWHDQGGAGTVHAYARRAGLPPPTDPDGALEVAETVPWEHRQLLERARPWLIERGDDGVRRLFTHGGWNPGRAPEAQTTHDLRIGREMWAQARILDAVGGAGPETTEGAAGPAGAGAEDGAPRRLTSFDEVYLGHTPTDWLEPRPVLEIWNLDQGAGWDGVLTLMDVHSHEYWQSDPVPGLYPGVQGRQ